MLLRCARGGLARENAVGVPYQPDAATYEGIGEGLGEAGATDLQLKAYMDSLAGQDAAKRAAMQKGYDAKKK